MSTTDALRQRYESALEILTDVAVEKLEDVVGKIPASVGKHRVREMSISATSQLASAYGGAAGELATAYVKQSGIAGASVAWTKPEAALSRDQVRVAVLAILGDQDSGPIREGKLTRLSGFLGKAVRLPANETVVAAANAARARFARLPDPGACAWCMKLASRGAVYTQDTVLTAKVGRRYHDGCRCTAVIVNDDGDLPDVNRVLEQSWRAGVIDESMTTQQLYQALRDSGVDNARVAAGVRAHAGSIRREPGAKQHQHELDTAERLKALGHSIVFRKPSEREGEKDYDSWVNGVATEFKSPTSRNPDAVRKLLRTARGQAADQTVIDMHRTTMSVEDAKAGVQEFFRRHQSGGMKVYLLTRDHGLIEVSEG